MINEKISTFKGFSRKSLTFLKDLKANNTKAWFMENKQDYIEYLLTPLQNLVQDLSEFMLNIDPQLETRPAVSKTISRIYRDTRFSHDKSPYKNRMWLTFKRPIKNWQDAPSFFFEISPDSYRYGMGFFSASKDTMDKLRGKIDSKPKDFLKVLSLYTKQRIFVIEGEKYKRILNETQSEEILNWYQRKNLYFVCNKNIDEGLFTKDLIDDLITGFRLLSPFYHFLWELKI